jgi:hypothetical protein
MGLIGYYCKFVHNYGKIAAPLTALLKNNAFTWTPSTNQSFHTLKEAMCKTLVLKLPDFTNIFFLECDTSWEGIGAVLMQYGRPLTFTSKKTWRYIWANQSMKMKCWLLCMPWISGILIGATIPN